MSSASKLEKSLLVVAREDICATCMQISLHVITESTTKIYMYMKVLIVSV